MMNKRGQAEAGIIGGVIAVIIGIAMLPIFASLIDQEQIIRLDFEQQITNTAFNQSFTLTNNDLISGSLEVTNGSCSSDITTCTGLNHTLRENLEFRVNILSGVLRIINRTGTWNLTYDYEPTNYIDSAVGRTVARQITLMYAVALILIAVAAAGIVMSRR